jgi:hypothetical protein
MPNAKTFFLSLLTVSAAILIASDGFAAPVSEVEVAPAVKPMHLAKAPHRDAAKSPDANPMALKHLAEEAARANKLPPDYFLRLIHRESQFQKDVVSPAGAEGIAQFMPATAQDRGLKDPFDPNEALPKAAALLSDLKQQFGNLGLAAAAYNAGPRRVQDWLAGRGYLPLETRLYVLSITGRSAEDWAPPGGRLLKYSNPSPLEALARTKAVIAKRNWELALLLSIAATETEKNQLLASVTTLHSERPTRSAKAARRHDLRGAKAEAALCSTCIIRSFY